MGQQNGPGTCKLILIPALITLGITLLRLGAEFMELPAWLASRAGSRSRRRTDASFEASFVCAAPGVQRRSNQMGELQARSWMLSGAAPSASHQAGRRSAGAVAHSQALVLQLGFSTTRA